MLLKDVNVVVLSSISALMAPFSDGDSALNVLGALVSPSAAAFPLHIVVSHEIFGHEPTRKLYQSIISARFPHAFSTEDSTYPKIHLLDVGLARKARTSYMEATESLSSEPQLIKSPSSALLNKYQASLETSNVTQFSRALETSLKKLPSSSAQLSMLSALRVTGLVLSQCGRNINDASRGADLALEQVNSLRSNARKASRKTVDSMEFRTRPHDDLAKESVQLYLDDLPWWKLPWRVDNIHAEISAILGETYGHKLKSTVSVFFVNFMYYLVCFYYFRSVAQLRSR